MKYVLDDMMRKIFLEGVLCKNSKIFSQPQKNFLGGWLPTYEYDSKHESKQKIYFKEVKFHHEYAQYRQFFKIFAYGDRIFCITIYILNTEKIAKY